MFFPISMSLVKGCEGRVYFFWGGRGEEERGEIGKPLTLASTHIQDYTQPEDHIRPTYEGVQPIYYIIWSINNVSYIRLFIWH